MGDSSKTHLKTKLKDTFDTVEDSLVSGLHKSRSKDKGDSRMSKYKQLTLFQDNSKAEDDQDIILSCKTCTKRPYCRILRDLWYVKRRIKKLKHLQTRIDKPSSIDRVKEDLKALKIMRIELVLERDRCLNRRIWLHNHKKEWISEDISLFKKEEAS